VTFFYAQLVLALSLLITAFTQYHTITLYHLFLCTQLIWIIKSGFGILQVGSLFPNSIISAFHSLMQLLFILVWIALDIATLHRVTKWEHRPGECFLAYYGSGHDRFDLQFVLCLDLAMIVYFGFAVPILKHFKWKCTVRKDWQKPMSYLGGFLQLTFLFGFFMWTSVSIYLTRLANENFIQGSEYSWGFGQVNAIVTTVFSLTSVITGYRSKKEEERRERGMESGVEP
jgi:hypothetical protein